MEYIVLKKLFSIILSVLLLNCHFNTNIDSNSARPDLSPIEIKHFDTLLNESFDLLQRVFWANLQSWDIQQEEAIDMVREALTENHKLLYPMDNDYLPDNEWRFLCEFQTYINEYGFYREWYCGAFYKGMPYHGEVYKIESPTGKLQRYMHIDKTDFEYNEDDDIKAAYNAILMNENALLSWYDMESEFSNVSYSLSVDDEYLGVWIMKCRLIPLQIVFTDNDNEIRKTAYIKIQQKYEMDNGNGCHFWQITCHSDNTITGYYHGLLAPNQNIPRFEDNTYIFEQKIEVN